MELQSNQAALILETSDEGEISVSVASSDNDNLATLLCQVIAQKLTLDKQFQEEILIELEEG